MCGGLIHSALDLVGLAPPKMPKAPDPAAERAAASAEATRKANAGIRMQRQAMRSNSLFTGGGDPGVAGGAGYTGGRDKLGV
jgi:hypothetical protein